MKQLVLIVIILALSIQVSTEVTRKREEGEIILEKADITASKSSDDLGCLVDLVTSKEPCQVHTTGADGDVYERAWFQFSLKDKLHCVTRIDVSVKTTIRDQAHYRYTCQKSGCDVINFIEGTEKLNERDTDQYALSGEAYVQEGEEEGRSDPSCTGMVGDNIKILAMTTDMTFYEVWVFGGKLIFYGL